MLITKRSQLELGKVYYYADYHNPNLKHQEDGVGVYSVIYGDISEEYKKAYGFYPPEKLMLKSITAIYFGGRNLNDKKHTYFGVEWINQNSFYTTISEACQDATYKVFNRYNPYKE